MDSWWATWSSRSLFRSVSIEEVVGAELVRLEADDASISVEDWLSVEVSAMVGLNLDCRPDIKEEQVWKPGAKLGGKF